MIIYDMVIYWLKKEDI